MAEYRIPWTDERIELFKKLYAEGLSFSEIADRLGGGITRNAAIGKARRLNFVMRAVPHYRPKKPYKVSDYLPRAEPLVAKPVKEKKPPSLAPSKVKSEPKTVSRALVLAPPKPLYLDELPENGRFTVLHLSKETCKWPIGEPGTKDFCFCAHTPRDKSPYCEFHARAAYQPMQERKHRVFG